MNVRYFTDPDGTEMAVLPKEELEDLQDAAVHAPALADYRADRLPGLTGAQALALAEAPTPFAFWHQYRRVSQAELAQKAGLSLNDLSELESGKRTGSVELWLRIGEALDLPVEDLVDAD